MSLQSEYDEKLQCLFTVGKDKLHFHDFLDLYPTIKIPDPISNVRILTDYREADPSGLTTSDIEQMKSIAIKLAKRFESVREAVVVSETLTYGLSRMYGGVNYSEQYELNVFNDINEAKIWLGLEPEAVLAPSQQDTTPPDSQLASTYSHQS